MNLRTAIAISALAHISAIIPVSGFVFREQAARQTYTLELDYILPAAAAPADSAPPALTLKKDAPKDAGDEKVKPPKSRSPVSAGAQIAPAKAHDAKEVVKAYKRGRPHTINDEKQISKNAGLGYCQILRDKIRYALRSNYKGSAREGDIYLVFILDKGGRLIDYDINAFRSTSDRRLTAIVDRSINQASPFPPLPEGAKGDLFTFNITIAFKET